MFGTALTIALNPLKLVAVFHRNGLKSEASLKRRGQSRRYFEKRVLWIPHFHCTRFRRSRR